MKIDAAALAARIVEQLDTECLLAHSTPTAPTPGPTIDACHNAVELVIRRHLEEHDAASVD